MPGPTKNYESVATETGDIGTLKSQLREFRAQYPKLHQYRNRGFQIDNFSDVTGWSANFATASGSTTSYAGEQSLTLTATGEDTINASKTYSSPFDLTNKRLSFAFKRALPSSADIRLRVQVRDASGDDAAAFSRLLGGETTEWQRYDFGHSVLLNSTVDLANIETIFVRLDTIGGTAVDWEVYYDDFRLVPTPDQGYVVLTFDDGLDTHYTEAYEYMENYGMPGVANVHTDSIGTTGNATVAQLEEMQAAGWDIASHGSNHNPATEITDDELRTSLEESKQWLLDNGFVSGARFYTYVGTQIDDGTRDIVTECYDWAMGASRQPWGVIHPVHLTTPLDINRYPADSASLSNTTDWLDNLARFGGVGAMTFHDIGTDISVSNFQAIIDHIESKDDTLQVITMRDWLDMQREPPVYEPRSESGTAAFEGDGTTTTFTVSHDMQATPAHVSVTPDLDSDAVAVDGVQNQTESSFDVVFSSAPAAPATAGTNNVTVSYEARR